MNRSERPEALPGKASSISAESSAFFMPPNVGVERQLKAGEARRKLSARTTG